MIERLISWEEYDREQWASQFLECYKQNVGKDPLANKRIETSRLRRSPDPRGWHEPETPAPDPQEPPE